MSKEGSHVPTLFITPLSKRKLLVSKTEDCVEASRECSSLDNVASITADSGGVLKETTQLC